MDDIRSAVIVNLLAQMRKGLLAFCVLTLCSRRQYSSDIVKRLRQEHIEVVEVTLYQLLTRLAEDGLLAFEWKPAGQGPPRKYYWLTPAGETAQKEMETSYGSLTTAITNLRRAPHEQK